MKNFLLYLGLILGLFSCDSGTTENTNNNSDVSFKSGGEIIVPLDSYFLIEKPTAIQKVEGAQISTQIFESLVKFNSKTLEIEPAIAEKWEVSEDGLIYTFHIRDGVKYHDNPCFEGGIGRTVVPEDVMNMFNRVYTDVPENTAYFMFQNTVKGGDDFFNGDTTAISGVKIDGNKVSIELVHSNNVFLSRLATVYGSIVPNELFDAEEWVPVGTGPFVYNVTESSSELVLLTKNKDYWMKDSGGIQLPYLDKVAYKFYEDESLKIEKFWTGENAMVKKVPITKVSEVLVDRIGDFEGKNAKYVLESVPQMSTTYLEFNMNSKIFKDVRIRQAFNLAIDRKKLVEKVLKNQAYEIGKYGITPPLTKAFKNYNFEAIEEVGYTRNAQKAKELLAEAGYPDGKGFPTISAQFKLDNSMYLVMSEIQKQLLSVLNVNIDIEQVEFNQLLENNAFGKADIFENIWIGDFPNAESFLAKFYGDFVPEDLNAPSWMNSGRYVNPEFDEMFEKGVFAKSVVEGNEYFVEAERLLMQDAPLIVLFYGESLMLKQANLKNFYSNGLNYMDFTHVYLENNSAKTEVEEEAH